MTSILPKITQKITTANSQLTLQLLLKNSSNEALSFRPTIEDWVIDNIVNPKSKTFCGKAIWYCDRDFGRVLYICQ